MIDLARAIKRLREISGITQVLAARKLKISPVYMNYVEHGTHVPSPKLVARIRDLFGVDPYVLAWCTWKKDGSDDMAPYANNLYMLFLREAQLNASAIRMKVQ